MVFDKNWHYELLIQHEDISNTLSQLCSDFGMNTCEGHKKYQNVNVSDAILKISQIQFFNNIQFLALQTWHFNRNKY